MSKYVYFVRHGECQANVDGIIAGAGDDSPLTERGKQQALETAEALSGTGFDLIVASPMSRAYDSAKIIAEAMGLSPEKIIKKQEFTEKDVGEYRAVAEAIDSGANMPPIILLQKATGLEILEGHMRATGYGLAKKPPHSLTAIVGVPKTET